MEIALMMAVATGIIVAIGLYYISKQECQCMKFGDKKYVRYNGKTYLATYYCSTRRDWYWFDWYDDGMFYDLEIHYTDII